MLFVHTGIKLTPTLITYLLEVLCRILIDVNLDQADLTDADVCVGGAELAEDLQRALREHVLWAELNGQEGRRASLQGVNLAGANLAGIFLSGADLGGCDLSDADISDGTFMLARLTDANMVRVIARATDFSGADLSGANLHAAKLNATVFGVVETRGAVGDMSGCSMPTNLTRADYSDPGNTSVDLGDAVLSYTNVASAIMDRY